jgi:hypothetical protein
MKTEWMKQTLSVVISSTLLLAGTPAQILQAQSTSSTPPAVAPLTTTQIDSLVAPIALYPDALVAQVLAAAAFPEQLAFADDWMNQNQNLQGDALTQAVDQQTWDPAVKALTQFPSVLHNLAKNLSWTSSLGDAFQNQASDVMEAVQYMRAQAQAAGTLQSNSQIKVVQQSPQTIVIEPATSNVVYVPQYNPAVVFGAPVVVPAYAPPVGVAAGISFGAGVAVGAALGGGGWVGGGGGWGWGTWGLNWGGGGGGGGTVINNNTYINRTNINRNSNNNNNNGNFSNNGNRNSGNRNNGNGNFANNGNRNSNDGNGSFNNNGNRTNEANNNRFGGGNRPDVPNGGYNGNHGLIGGRGGTQQQFAGDQQRDRFGSEQPRSAMNGDGNFTRAQANRGRSSMNPAAFRQQRQPQQRQMQQRQPRMQMNRGGGERGGRR